MSVTNRKVVITRFGDPSVLAIVEEQLPAPGDNEVQVAIIYSGFAGPDINMRMGVYPFQRKAPLTPGYCFVGRVKTNGRGIQNFKTGDIVCALTVYDSQAAYINISEKYLIPVPQGVEDLQQVVALVLDWSTAYEMIYHHARVEKDQRVFVHGVSGAVGQALLWLCKMKGAEVYGTASERNHDALREMGAHPFVYTDKEWIPAMQALGGAHAVFDPLGYDSLDESWSILSDKDSSTLIGYGLNQQVFQSEANNASSSSSCSSRSPIFPLAKLLSRNLAFWSNKSTSFFSISRDARYFEENMRILLTMLKEGHIKVPIKRVWNMEDIRDAHESWGKGQGMGSLVIRVSKSDL